MRFTSLHRYSYRKSPKDLQPAILACKLSLILAVLSAVLLVLSLFAVYHHQNNQSSDNVSSLIPHHSLPVKEVNSTETPIAQSDTNHTATSVPADQTTNPSFDFNVSAIICAVTCFIVTVCAMASVLYAYCLYRKYCQIRLRSYEMVNQSFDVLQRKRLERLKVVEPIFGSKEAIVIQVTDSNRKAKTKKTSQTKARQLEDDQALMANIENGPASRSKFALWARSKWKGSSNKHPVSKEMTI